MEKFHAFRFLQESKKIKDKGNKKKRKKRRKSDSAGIGDEISRGIKQAIAYETGELNAKETTLSTDCDRTTQIKGDENK